ncbi:NUDIX domain-containing protein [Streptomyces hokutonensis]|uniref:NUDIX domain-containing protein n=1 Tax=Streptomyces hokutonensis TaxID=1306990 RepID=A0ABW6M822_9ACTN
MSDPYLSPSNVMVLVVRGDGRILAVRHNAASKTSANQVTVVGGKLEAGEFLDEGALRELAEETGIHVAAGDLDFGQLVHYLDADGVRVIGAVFTTYRWQGEPHNAEPHKHDQILWVDPGHPPSDCHPYTRQVLENFRAGRRYGTITVPASGGGS